MGCSAAQALEVVGEWWTMLIVRDAFYGVRRFQDFQERLGVSRSVLALRLERLVDEGVLEAHLYSERPPRYEYRLSRKGLELFPVLVGLMQWGDKWASDKAPVVLRHETCGRLTSPRLTCSVCGEPVTHRNASAEAGPGASDLSALPVGATLPKPRKRSVAGRRT